MINAGYGISLKDAKKFHELRRSNMYAMYLKSVANSPAFKAIIKEHVSNIDISSDVQRMRNEGTIPSNIPTKAMNELFINSISKMAVNIVADSLILKELEEINIDKVSSDMEKESTIVYLLGMADKKYYEQAERLREEGEISMNDIAFRGLLEYTKIHSDLNLDGRKIVNKNSDDAPAPSGETTGNTLDLDSDNIIL